MSNPICPHCTREFKGDETWFSDMHDVQCKEDEVSDLKCPRCHKTFHVVCEISVKFHACDSNGELT